MRDALEAVPWLDVLAEAARHENLLASRRSDAGQDASAAVAESQRLFAATAAAAARAHTLLARLAERLAEDAPPARAAGDAA